MRYAPVTAWVVCSGLAACVSVPPRALDPHERAQVVSQRRLDSAEAQAALQSVNLTVPERWDLDHLTAVAWGLRPDIAAARLDVDRARIARTVAAAKPDPTLTIDPEYAVKTVPGGESPWYLGVALGLTLETAGKRGLRVQQATLAEELAQLGFAETLWSAREEVRAALLAGQAAQRSVDLAVREAQLETQFVEFAQRQLNAGYAGRPALLLAQSEAARAAAQSSSARNDLSVANGALALAAGVQPASLPPLANIILPDRHSLPTPANLETQPLRELTIAGALPVRRALLQYQQAQTALQLEVAKQYPDVNLGPGYIYDLGTQKIVMTLAFALPRQRAHRAAIEAARIEREKAAAQFDQVQSRALTELAAALERYRVAYAGVDAARLSAEQQEAAAQAALNQLHAGGIDRGEWLSAAVLATQRARAVLDAERTAIDALTAVETTVQRPLWPVSSLAR